MKEEEKEIGRREGLLVPTPEAAGSFSKGGTLGQKHRKLTIVASGK